MLRFETINQDEKFLPQKQTKGSAGLDVRTTNDLYIPPMCGSIYSTGVKIAECSENILLMMELRSSLRFKKGCSQLGVGIIDSDYRGEIRGMIFNFGNQTVKISAGERVAQLIIMENRAGDSFLSENVRTGGFGSTNHG